MSSRITIIVDPVREEMIRLPRELQRIRRHILWHLAFYGEKVMKEEAPVRTGELRESVWFDIRIPQGVVMLGAAAKHAL